MAGRGQISVPPIRPAQAKLQQGFAPAGQSRVLQRIKAYRVGTAKSVYKIQVDGGKVVKYEAGRSGIDISFGDITHADHYFRTKQSDPGARLVEWDFPDDLYEMIVAKIKHTGAGEIPDSWKAPKTGGAKLSRLQKMWFAISKLPAPVQSSDDYVKEMNIYAPHFEPRWIKIFNDFATGRAAKVYTYAEWIGAEEDGGGGGGGAGSAMEESKAVKVKPKAKAAKGAVAPEAKAEEERKPAVTKVWLYPVDNEQNGMVMPESEANETVDDSSDTWKTMSLAEARKRGLI